MDDVESLDHKTFMAFACLFEGGLLAAAWCGGWLVGVNPFADLTVSATAVGFGLAGTIPPFIGFLLAWKWPVAGFRRIRQFLIDVLGPLLYRCRWYDLIVLAILAGLCEEALFRGLLQPYIGRAGPIVGLLGSNILFALAHAITPLYAVYAGVTGIYLSVLRDVSGTSNLLIPIVTHAVYDYLAFLVVVRTHARGRVDSCPTVPGEPGVDSHPN